MKVSRERIPISITSPEFTTEDDRLFGVITERSKGKDQAFIIQIILEYFEIIDNIVEIYTISKACNAGRQAILSNHNTE